MNTESRRVERYTAAAVTSSIPANATAAGTRCHVPCIANSVAYRIAIPAPSIAFAVNR